MLFLIATPIGHLGDITGRALEILSSCDAILCEDTRRSSILLNKYGIKKPLYSYNSFKEKQMLQGILKKLEAGENLALISDAGTPCINDPGLILVRACIEKGVPFTALPGPCSLIQALVLSGFDTERFQFIGFLPRKPDEAIRLAFCYPGTTVCFESPERLIDTLSAMERIDPDREIAVVREMTKTFEECLRGKAGVLREHFEKSAPRGEIVLAIAKGKSPEAEMDLDELIGMLRDLHGLSLKEAIKLAAKIKQVPKSVVYKKAHS